MKKRLAEASRLFADLLGKAGQNSVQLGLGQGALRVQPAALRPANQTGAGGPVKGVVRPGGDVLKVVSAGDLREGHVPA